MALRMAATPAQAASAATVSAFAARSAGDALAIGDFNTCRAYVDEPGAIDVMAHFMDSMDAIGFCDLWRHRYPDGREFTWYSHRGNGFRIDHAFLSPSLAARAGVIRYSHEERLAGLSDHSVLLLDLQRRRTGWRGVSRSNAMPACSAGSGGASTAGSQRGAYSLERLAGHDQRCAALLLPEHGVVVL